MLKQVEIHGQRFELYTPDGGRTWASNPRSIVAFRRRREQAVAELRKKLELIDDDVLSFDPDDTYQVDFSNGSAGRF